MGQSGRVRKVLLIIIVNIAVICTLMVVIEVGGQLAYYLRHGKFVYQLVGYEYGQVFEPHPFLVARPKKDTVVNDYQSNKTITITDRNTRWTGAPEDDSKLIRVAVLGGSSTFGTGVTDADTWPALLQARLGDGYSVINYGVPSFSTAEAIIQMSLIVPAIKPDIIVLYEGWNDIFRYHTGDSPDYYNHGMDMYAVLVLPVEQNQSLMGRLEGLSAIVKFATKIKNKFFRGADSAPCKKFDAPDPDVDSVYVRNLETLKLLSERVAPYTLFVPQVLNYDEFLTHGDDTDCNWFAGGHVQNSAMPRLMDRLNLFMRDVCSKDDPRCMYVDGVLNVDWEPDDFVDYGHFSRKGGEKFADVLNQVITIKVKEEKIHVGVRSGD